MSEATDKLTASLKSLREVLKPNPADTAKRYLRWSGGKVKPN